MKKNLFLILFSFLFLSIVAMAQKIPNSHFLKNVDWKPILKDIKGTTSPFFLKKGDSVFFLQKNFRLEQFRAIVSLNGEKIDTVMIFDKLTCKVIGLSHIDFLFANEFISKAKKKIRKELNQGYNAIFQKIIYSLQRDSCFLAPASSSVIGTIDQTTRNLYIQLLDKELASSVLEVKTKRMFSLLDSLEFDMKNKINFDFLIEQMRIFYKINKEILREEEKAFLKTASNVGDDAHGWNDSEWRLWERELSPHMNFTSMFESQGYQVYPLQWTFLSLFPEYSQQLQKMKTLPRLLGEKFALEKDTSSISEMKKRIIDTLAFHYNKLLVLNLKSNKDSIDSLKIVTLNKTLSADSAQSKVYKAYEQEIKLRLPLLDKQIDSCKVLILQLPKDMPVPLSKYPKKWILTQYNIGIREVEKKYGFMMKPITPAQKKEVLNEVLPPK